MIGLKCAQAILLDLLTIRADRDHYYYAMDAGPLKLTVRGLFFLFIRWVGNIFHPPTPWTQGRWFEN